MRIATAFPAPLAATAALVITALAASAPAPAYACSDPDDCKGLSREELARDRAEIRRLNREQLRYVERRDAEYARGWEAYDRHAQDMDDYERSRADYERRMREWREAVRRCRGGDWRYCGG
ncbi:hypothetical protein NAP1_07160 [Erythrobacter sp. NAP1]|uniref:hypothetical protein n=1 Tax=Erythrobacter sp. NAP1 TaxID=237727 RepID=UPI0000686D71|nr:hypothetical protein [Erythrobacter sp. NAP1]EAQ30538.1 hypothetical protein NAP1_07160 [Erythrobacter sp. NAP1]